MESQSEQSLEYSEIQAMYISMANSWLAHLEIPYLRESYKAMLDKAMRYDSMAVLVSNYDPTNSQLLTTQAKALKSLLDYADASAEIIALKKEVADHKQVQDDIDNLFKF